MTATHPTYPTYSTYRDYPRRGASAPPARAAGPPAAVPSGARASRALRETGEASSQRLARVALGNTEFVGVLTGGVLGGWAGVSLEDPVAAILGAVFGAAVGAAAAAMLYQRLASPRRSGAHA